MPKITIYNIETDEIIEREMTDDEIADIQLTFPNAFKEQETE